MRIVFVLRGMPGHSFEFKRTQDYRRDMRFESPQKTKDTSHEEQS
jgi:hypothetical protein